MEGSKPSSECGRKEPSELFRASRERGKGVQKSLIRIICPQMNQESISEIRGKKTRGTFSLAESIHTGWGEKGDSQTET